MILQRHLRSAAACAVFLALTGAASAGVKVGPWFPRPETFAAGGASRDALLEVQTQWLEAGIPALKKARAEAAAEKEKATSPDLDAKIAQFDADLSEAEKELALAKNKDGDREVQSERKRALVSAINQWINALKREATQQMKIVLTKDGLEAQTAQNRNYQLQELADRLEHEKHDPSIERWGK